MKIKEKLTDLKFKYQITKKIIKNKKGSEMWQLVALVLTLILIVVLMMFVFKAKKESDDFLGWLKRI